MPVSATQPLDSPLSTRRDGAAPWGVIRGAPAGAAYNMAVDEWLMTRAVERDGWLLRIYGWETPTLSLGRNQRAMGIYSSTELGARGIDLVRRPTGGRAILHHREITYAVAAPLRHAGDLRASYRSINELLLTGLRRLGVDASFASPTERAIPPGPIPCFDLPAAGELVCNGRKLVGSAQWRSADALLQHGSILVHDDQHLAAILGSTAPPPPAATLAAALDREPSIAEMTDVLQGVLLEERAVVEAISPPDPTDPALAPFVARYRSDEWTWRR